MSGHIGYTVVEVLPALRDKPWGPITQAYLRAQRPSEVRVIPHNGAMKCDARPWRVTVHLAEDGTVREIDQEVEVDLPDDVQHGYDLDCRMRRL